MPSERLRCPDASARCPVTGASTATTNPAMPSDQANQVLADVVPGRSSPTASVRYTEKTKVRMTALNAAEPQSHNPQAQTCPRVAGAAIERGSTAALLMNVQPRGRCLRIRVTASQHHDEFSASSLRSVDPPLRTDLGGRCDPDAHPSN